MRRVGNLIDMRRVATSVPQTRPVNHTTKETAVVADVAVVVVDEEKARMLKRLERVRRVLAKLRNQLISSTHSEVVECVGELEEHVGILDQIWEVERELDKLVDAARRSKYDKKRLRTVRDAIKSIGRQIEF